MEGKRGRERQINTKLPERWRDLCVFFCHGEREERKSSGGNSRDIQQERRRTDGENVERDIL